MTSRRLPSWLTVGVMGCATLSVQGDHTTGNFSMQDDHRTIEGELFETHMLPLTMVGG